MDERERLFQELVRYYRYSAVGRRTTGIVHNFNTPLQVLSLNFELLERKIIEEEKKFAAQLSPGLRQEWEGFAGYKRKKLKQSKEELERLQQMGRSIIFQGMHEERQDRQSLNLNQILQEELELYAAERFYKHQVEKRLHFRPELPPLSGYYIDLSQSFRHLVDNALEAMARVDSPVLTVETAKEEGRRIIRVGDNGMGIAPPDLPHIFEPFFTTKDTPQSPHAGLGLFFVQRLLAPYQGEIRVTSQPGETMVTVVLP
jgi:signal transduction histidine kinase